MSTVDPDRGMDVPIRVLTRNGDGRQIRVMTKVLDSPEHLKAKVQVVHGFFVGEREDHQRYVVDTHTRWEMLYHIRSASSEMTR